MICSGEFAASPCCFDILYLISRTVEMQLLAMIGEQFEESDEICGAVVSVRRAQDKIAIWTKTASNEVAQVCNMLYSHTSVTI